jgi:magnesium-transporting ATPase (P-type)
MHRNNTTHRSSVSVPNIILDKPWTKSKEEVANYYKVDEANGLTEERVRQDLERYGPNGKKTPFKLHDLLVFLFE